MEIRHPLREEKRADDTNRLLAKIAAKQNKFPLI
jgi:hypothetical protein